MALSVAQLQALLGQLQQGSTFTLKDTDLGIVGVQQLFDQYLPDDTLTLTGATADTTALTVTGQFTLDAANSNLATTAQFLCDDQQQTVTGIVITAQVPAWSIQTSFLTFDGSALETLGFSALAFVMSAQPDSLGNVAPATGIGVTLPFTGSGGSVSLPLVALLGSATQDPFLLQGSVAPVAIDSLSALAGGFPPALAGKASFDVVPALVPVDGSSLALTGVSVTLSPALSSPVVMLSAVVFLADQWTLLASDPTFVPLTDIQATIGAPFPASGNAAGVTVQGTLTLSGGVEIAAGFGVTPSVSMLAELETSVPLAPILSDYLPALSGNSFLAGMDVTSALATVDFSPLAFQIQLSLSDAITLTSGVTFENIALSLSGGSSAGMSAGAAATFDVDGFDVMVGLAIDPSTGFSFVGKASNGNAPAGATNVTGIDIGNVIAMLAATFGWTAPQALASLELTDLELQADTGTSNFQFLLDGTFALANASGAFTVTANLTCAGGYTATVSGELTLTAASGTTLVFDVSFQEGAGSTQISASWKDEGGSVSLTDIATALGFEAPGIPSGLDIALTGVSFTYDTSVTSQTLSLTATATQGAASFMSTGSGATTQYAFSLEVDDTISLSNLPLVGKALSDVETASLEQIQVHIASASATASSSASLTLVLNLGGQTTPVTLSMDGTASGAQQFVVPDAVGTGTSSADGVTWFSVQQSFGPVTIDQVGLKYSDSVLWALITATMSVGGLTVTLNGLSVGTPITSFSPEFNLDGLTIQYTNPPLAIGGSFLQVTPQAPVTLQFNGGVIIGTPDFTIDGYGSYAVVSGQPSLFIFAEIAGAFGGPAALFVTGLAGGFGFNSQLALPTLSQVAQFPMVAALPGTSSYNAGALGGSATQPPTPLQALQALTSASPAWITPAVGEYWGALGITFTTYDLVKSQALVIVEAGNALTVSLLGTSTAQFPQSGSDLYAWVQLDLEAEFAPAQGEFWLEAELAANSFLLSQSCLLSGGFAFAVWYGPSPYAGDFVLTLGGYNPGFDPPSYYPTVPRVGFHWQLDSTIDISGSAYLALTPSMLMVGGALDVTYQSGRLKAWLDLYADVLVRWNPFWFQADFGVSVGASYTLHIFGITKTITAELGASVDLWGPPTGGTVTVKWHIFSFTIDFGAPLDASASAQQATWDDVVATLPNTGTADAANILGLNAVSGVNPPAAQQPASTPASWSVRGATFAFTTATSVPASSATVGTTAPTTVQGQPLNVAPLYVSGATSVHTLTITDGNGGDQSSAFEITGITGSTSAALFGTSGALSVPSGDAQLIPNQLVGLSLVIQVPTQGNTAGPVSVGQVLDFDDMQLAGAVMPLSLGAQAQGDIPTASPTTVAVLTDTTDGITSSAVTTARTTIFDALTSLDYGPGSNDALMQFSADLPDDLAAQPLLVVTS